MEGVETVKKESDNHAISRSDHIQVLESKLAKLKAGKEAKSATSMINTLKMAREDSARILVSQSALSTTGRFEEPYSFLDKLYSTNALYRHMFPVTQALGTDEKELLLKNEELSNTREEENVSSKIENTEAP